MLPLYPHLAKTMYLLIGRMHSKVDYEASGNGLARQCLAEDRCWLGYSFDNYRSSVASAKMSCLSGFWLL